MSQSLKKRRLLFAVPATSKLYMDTISMRCCSYCGEALFSDHEYHCGELGKAITVYLDEDGNRLDNSGESYEY